MNSEFGQASSQTGDSADRHGKLPATTYLRTYRRTYVRMYVRTYVYKCVRSPVGYTLNLSLDTQSCRYTCNI